MSGMQHRDIITDETRARLEQANTRPLWEVADGLGDRDRSLLEPIVWKGDELMELLREVEDVPREIADELPYERRALIPVNPGLGWSVSPTILLGLQGFPANDRAIPHRHPHTAPRFILNGGEGLSTVVEGEALPGHDHDLLMTPSWKWHGHINESDERAVWLSIVDQAFVMEGLGLTTRELFDGDDWVYKPDGYYNNQFGALRPAGSESDGSRAPYRFAWDHCYEVLLEAEAENDDAHDPYNGVNMEYANPASGQPPLAPTFSLRLQLLRDGEVTDAHKHNAVELYYVIQGEGETDVDGETLSWEAGDLVQVPPFEYHSHASDHEESILLGMTDAPLLEAFNLYREEAR